jgi:hypothetical protein
LIVYPQVNGQELQGLIIELGEKLASLPPPLFFFHLVDILMASDATMARG